MASHENVLTQEHEVAVVLQHHISVQVLLRGVEQLPLLQRELHGHVLERYLGKRDPVRPAVTPCRMQPSLSAVAGSLDASPLTSDSVKLLGNPPFLKRGWTYRLTSTGQSGAEVTTVTSEIGSRRMYFRSGNLSCSACCEAALWRGPGGKGPGPPTTQRVNLAGATLAMAR